MKRKIGVVTGSRAEFGLLRWLMRDIAAEPSLELQVLVTGMHLAPEFGLTWKEIEGEGLPISAKVDIQLELDTPAAIAKSMGLALMGLGEAYARLRPDMLVVLGDRFEILAAVAAAVPARIPVAHLHGGELTEGAMDDGFRHAITKMSHLHFASTEAYRQRIIQMGEAPEYVFNVGAVGLDGMRKTRLLAREELEKTLGFRFRRQNLLVTFHPVTLDNNTSEAQFRALLEAVDGLEDTGIIFTKANADTYGRVINRLLGEYAASHPGKVAVFTSLGQERYLSTLRAVEAVVGNSSSGIIEAPSLQTATVNVGDRQKGRIRAASVIDCAPTAPAIRQACQQALSEGFQRSLPTVVNPYDQGEATAKILEELRRPWPENLLRKRFRDYGRLDSAHGVIG